MWKTLFTIVFFLLQFGTAQAFIVGQNIAGAGGGGCTGGDDITMFLNAEGTLSAGTYTAGPSECWMDEGTWAQQNEVDVNNDVTIIGSNTFDVPTNYDYFMDGQSGSLLECTGDYATVGFYLYINTWNTNQIWVACGSGTYKWQILGYTISTERRIRFHWDDGTETAYTSASEAFGTVPGLYFVTVRYDMDNAGATDTVEAWVSYCTAIGSCGTNTKYIDVSDADKGNGTPNYSIIGNTEDANGDFALDNVMSFHNLTTDPFADLCNGTPFRNLTECPIDNPSE